MVKTQNDVISDGSVNDVGIVQGGTQVNSSASSELYDGGKSDLTDFAKSVGGKFAMNEVLYKSGLENIFNDYQKNIANLTREKQTQVEDAYYVRELSKKYLGEYASNAGIGDVSGNLIDIYANYSKNKVAIDSAFQSNKMNLDQNFQEAKAEQTAKIFENRYNKSVEQYTANTRTVISDITTGKTDGLSTLEFLESKKGSLLENEYTELYDTFYMQGVEEVANNIQNAVYGVDKQGKTIGNAQDYLSYAQKEYKLSEREMNEFKKLVEDTENERALNASMGYVSIKNPYNSSNEENPDYSASFDPTYLSNLNDNVNSTSSIYRNTTTGENLVQVLKPVDKDKKAKIQVSSQDIFNNANDYLEKNGGGVITEDFIFYNRANATNYVHKNGEWFRLVVDSKSSNATNALTDSVQKTFVGKSGDFSYNGIKYKDGDISFNSSSPTSDLQKEVIKQFNKIHGDSLNATVVFYDNKFWKYKPNGSVVVLKRK